MCGKIIRPEKKSWMNSDVIVDHLEIRFFRWHFKWIKENRVNKLFGLVCLILFFWYCGNRLKY